MRRWFGLIVLSTILVRSYPHIWLDGSPNSLAGLGSWRGLVPC
jgi:hypothetical protein